MRVFDSYYYNIIDRVKYKDTKAYIDKMLGELGFSYQNIGFSMYCGPVEKAVEKYPVLEKYHCLEDETLPKEHRYVNELLTSYSRNWEEGEIFADPLDTDAIAELFTKIPRTYNFGFSHMILSGIDWYGGCDLAPAIERNECCSGRPLKNTYYFSWNGIMIDREFDYGNKLNRVIVSVEATAALQPKDTSDIAKRLLPYLGEPEYVSRVCRFSGKELMRNEELKKKYEQSLETLFGSALKHKGSGNPRSSFEDSSIPRIAGKKKIAKAFKGTGFEMGNRKGLLPGMNRVVCTDAHHFKYELLFDRGQVFGNSFSFNLMIMGYNFVISLSQKDFYVESEEEAEEIINELAKYCVLVRDRIGEEMAADFSDTPDWYWEKKNYPDW